MLLISKLLSVIFIEVMVIYLLLNSYPSLESNDRFFFFQISSFYLNILVSIFYSYYASLLWATTMLLNATNSVVQSLLVSSILMREIAMCIFLIIASYFHMFLLQYYIFKKTIYISFYFHSTWLSFFRWIGFRLSFVFNCLCWGFYFDSYFFFLSIFILASKNTILLGNFFFY